MLFGYIRDGAVLLLGAVVVCNQVDGEVIMAGFVQWAHEWYLICLILSFAFVLVELFIVDQVRKRPKSYWRFLLLLSGWPLVCAVLFIFGAAGVWAYSWLVLF